MEQANQVTGALVGALVGGGAALSQARCRVPGARSRAGAVTVPAVTPPLAADNAQLGGEKYIWCGYTSKCLGEYKYVCKRILSIFYHQKLGLKREESYSAT